MKNVIVLGLVATMLVACGKKEEEVAAPAAPAVVEAPAPAPSAPAAEAAPAASAPAVTENAEKAPAK